MPNTVRRTIFSIVGFTLALIVLFFISYLSRSTDKAKKAQEMGNSTDYLAVICLSEAWGFSQKAEAAYNGYIATGRPSLKAPYEQSIQNLDLRLAAAKELCEDTVPLRTLEDLYMQKNQIDGRMRSIMKIREKEGYAKALEEIRNSDTETFLSQFRSSIGNIIELKRESLVSGLENVNKFSTRQTDILFVGNILTFVFLCVSVWALTREMVDRDHAEKAITGVQNELINTRMELDKGRNEISKMEEAEKDLTLYNEQLKKKTKDLENFASMASKDLKNPIQQICDTSRELVEYFEEDLDEQGMEYLRDIANSANHMEGLLKTLGEYSQVNASLKPFTIVNLDGILKTVIKRVDTFIDRSGGGIETEPLGEIQADSNQMEQLFYQLVSNAAKFHKEEDVAKVSITCKKKKQVWALEDGEEEVEVVCISVKDNGIGFNTRFTKRIFSPFEKLNTWHNYNDPGMGLTIAKRIIERHHGKISVHSRVDEGSEFIVTLPIEQRNDFLKQEIMF
jgi:signal transduction histidine kinase